MGLGPKQFSRSNGGNRRTKLYKWSPQSNEKKKLAKRSRPFFCNATGGSQGEDWIVTYVYNTVVTDGIAQRIAYVACDYVK